ncbi:Hypp5866 [Branchiostoma lanceolatum]|uniref:Hypp5866 protein n=1 Tax=Branchiostoma lanceolatum TaxID=7740 RepID=A0A8J9YSI8_BRALA|nr:Hypp5866 [Branchiostoma lanceolatum]
MAILQRSCCGCCDVKTGSFVVAGIWIVLTLIGLGYTGYRVSIVAAFGLVAPTDVVILIVYIVNLITHILLIVGVAQEVRPLILTWVIVTIICTVVSLIVYAYVTVATLGVIAAIAAGSDNQSAILGAGIAGIAIVWIIWGVFFILTVYGCLVVYSHYQNLRDAAMGRGQQQMVVMGNQPAMQGIQPYGNQPYGNQPYGNQPYGNQAYGNQPALENKQPAMTGPQPGLGQDSSDVKL